jgi:hypothetical protein
MRIALLAVAVLLTSASSLPAQSADHQAVVAVADSSLAALSRSDFVAFTDLMVDEATVIATLVRNGVPEARVSTRVQWRSRTAGPRLTERGWNPTVQLQAGIATVWYPYDFYIDGHWSHCGIDTFTLVKRADRWLIVTLAYTIEQPPACERHPAGPPVEP